VNEPEAELVRHIFHLYLEHRSAYAVLRCLRQEGRINKCWVTKKGKEMGGKPFVKTVIYRILKDEVYIGKVGHKGAMYEGAHEAIIPEEIWHQAQELLQKQSVQTSKLRIESGTLLRSKCVDGEGRSYTTTYSVKRKNTQHRYYINKQCNHRIRGDRLEKVVFDAIHYACLNPQNMRPCFTGEYALMSEEEGMYRLRSLWAHWDGLTEKDKYAFAHQMIEKVTILPASTTIRIGYAPLNDLLKAMKPFPSAGQAPEPQVTNEPAVSVYDNALEITLPIIFKRTGKTSHAFDSEGKAFEVFETAGHNMTLINALAKSYKWNRFIADGEKTITEMATDYKVSRTYISQMLNLTMLAPDIVESILNGRQPKHLRLKDLMQSIPLDWESQKLKLNYL